MRFWEMSTKVERKIASTEAHKASIIKLSPQTGTPGTQPRFATIQNPKSSRWMTTKVTEPVKRVTWWAM
jgi:hypothetical protein